MIQREHPLYNRWRHIIQCSYNPNSPNYINLPCHWQGGEFWHFARYVEKNLGLPPNKQSRLARKNPSKGFEPGNLVWLNARPHSRIMRNICILVKYQGQKISLRELADKTNISYWTIIRRYKKGFRKEKLWQ